MIELLVVLGLATWRISIMLTAESGPYDIFGKIRDVFGLYYDEYSNCQGGAVTAALCCVECTSIWVAGFLAFVFFILGHLDVWSYIPFVCATSAISVFLGRLTKN